MSRTAYGARARAEREREEAERQKAQAEAPAETEEPTAPIADELAAAAATAIEAADRRRRRDQIMCAALTGLLADGSWPTHAPPDHSSLPADHRRRELTLRAWQIADAALATEPDLKS